MGSPANQEYLRSIGVCPFAYGEDLADRLRESADRFDAVLDCAGRGALRTVRRTIGQGARIASIADQGDGITTVFARPDTSALADLSQMASADILKVAVAATYPLEQAAEAQRALMRARAAGKIVLTL